MKWDLQKLAGHGLVIPRDRTSLLIILGGLLIGFAILVQHPFIPLVLLGICLWMAIYIEKPEISLIPVIFSYSILNVVLVHRQVHFNSLAIAGEPNHILLVDIFILACVFAVLAGRITGSVDPIKKTSIDIPLIALVMLAISSLLWTPELSFGFAILVQLLFCAVLLYLPMYLVRSRDFLKSCMWAFFISGVFVAAVSLSTLYVEAKQFSLFHYNFLSLKDFLLELNIFYMENLGPRVAGVTDPNRAAGLLNFAVLIGFGLFLITKNKLARSLVLVLWLFTLYMDLHTMSKGGLGALVFSLSVFVLLNPYFSGKKLRILATIYALIFLIMTTILLTQEGGLGRFGRNPLETRSQSSLANRFEWWSTDFERLYGSYGLGTGIGGMADKNWAYAQSSYFSLLAELGFIGFLIFLILIFIFSIEMYSSIKRVRYDLYKSTILLSLVCALMTFAIHSIVDFSYIMRAPWLLAGLFLAAARLGANKGAIRNE